MWPSRRIAQASDRGGFSLVEMLVAMSLLGVFIAAVGESVITGLRAVESANGRAHLRQELTHALQLIARDAGVANNVDRAETGEVQFDTPDVNNVEYVYDSGDGTLSRDDGDTTERILLRDLTALDVDYVDCLGASHTGTVSGSAEDTLRVMQVTATVARGTETFAMTHATFLRNMVGQESGTCGSS